MREDQIILAVTRDFLQNSNYSQREFGEQILHPALQAAGVEVAKSPKSVDEYSRQLSAMQNQFSRIMTGALQFPLSWKWSWIAALPDPYRGRCLMELMPQHTGQQVIPSPEESALDSVARLALEFGEAMTAVTVIASDNKINQLDNPVAVLRALNELYDVRDVSGQLAAAIEKSTSLRVNRSGGPLSGISLKVFFPVEG